MIDGEILPWREGHVLPFAQLQRRIGRKTLGKKILSEVPVIILAYDLLEWGGIDIRDQPLAQRRAQLAALVEATASPQLQLSPLVEANAWAELAALREQSRERNAEGLMLKRRSSPYRVGRQRGDWWKWKINPFTVDAVLIYAQRGTGKRASLYTDYTFGVWDNDQLVPFAKAYSGLTDAEIREVDSFVPAEHRREVWPRTYRQAGTRFRAGFRGHSAFPTTQIRDCRALPANSALAHG